MLKYFLIAVLLLYIWSFFIEPNLLVVKNYRVEWLNGLKIVFVSDFHISKSDKKRLVKIVNKINEQNPDLVLSGGDYIKGHNEKSTLPIEEQAKILKQINAPVITVLGNHDGLYNKDLVRKALQDANITVLENSNIKFGEIYIAGLEDIQTGIPDIDLALKNTKTPRILLTHSPDIYYDVKEKTDLILAGHVHGGQVSIPLFGALIVPSKYGSKFAKGIIEETENKMIITKGLGTSILNVRFCTFPEIVVINGE